MKVAIYSRSISDKTEEVILELIEVLQSEGISFCIFQQVARELLQKHSGLKIPDVFSSSDKLKTLEVDYLISVGGDGTLLDTVSLVKDSGIPVMGINTGRLGFLAAVPRHMIQESIGYLVQGHYTIDPRSLLLLESNGEAFKGENFALNDFVIYKNASSSMIVVHTYLNGEYLNSYWSDGIIISTPTGSTGYSLSCGGPILLPNSSSFVITPIAPHNLNVRPLIVSDGNVFSFEIEGRTSSFMASLDSRTEVLPLGVQLAVKKADFIFNLLRFNTENYLETLRSKLMWGIDSRNY